MLRLWDSVQPRSSRARTEDAAEYATATAQHLFDRVSSPVSSGFIADTESALRCEQPSFRWSKEWVVRWGR